MSGAKPGTPPYFGINAIMGLVLTAQGKPPCYPDNFYGPLNEMLNYLLPEDDSIPFHIKAQLALKVLRSEKCNDELRMIDKELQSLDLEKNKEGRVDETHAPSMSRLYDTIDEQFERFQHAAIFVEKLSPEIFEKYLDHYRHSHEEQMARQPLPRVNPDDPRAILSVLHRQNDPHRNRMALQFQTFLSMARSFGIDAGDKQMMLVRVEGREYLKMDVASEHAQSMKQLLVNMGIEPKTQERSASKVPGQDKVIFLIDSKIIKDEAMFGQLNKIARNADRGSFDRQM